MPKPLRDPLPKPAFRPSVSRRRLVEFAVIVLGVLVALGLENLIQEARFRGDARDLERSFTTDLSGAVVLSLERQGVQACLVQRLRVLAAHADGATGNREPVAPVASAFSYATPQVYSPPTRVWVTTSFDRALGSEAFKRIPRDRADAYASLFALIRGQQELNDGEFLAAMGLAPLAYSQPDMDAQVRADALQQISNLDRHQAVLAMGAGQIVEAALSLPIIGEDVRRSLREQTESLREFRSDLTAAYGDCFDSNVFDRLMTPAPS